MVLGVARLSDQRVQYDIDNKIYTYGLAKENSLKRAVYNIITEFGQEKGLIEQIESGKEFAETCSLLKIYYLLTFALEYPSVLDYMLELPPISYLSSNPFDWYKKFVKQ